MNRPQRDFPEALSSDRLIIRPVQLGDARELNAAVRESFAEICPWMPWAKELPSLQDSVKACHDMRVKWLARAEIMLVFVHRQQGEIVGCGGFHHILWEVPSFDTGYWCRTRYTRQGLITEAVKALSRFVFDEWGARRLAITCDERNVRSWQVAERAGFQLEGTSRNDQLDLQGQPRNTRIYARVH